MAIVVSDDMSPNYIIASAREAKTSKAYEYIPLLRDHVQTQFELFDTTSLKQLVTDKRIVLDFVITIGDVVISLLLAVYVLLSVGLIIT